MSNSLKSESYHDKAGTYFAHERLEMMPFVPLTARRILEVGCGVGAFGAALKRRSPCVVEGVEIVPAKAAEASIHLDHVWVGPFDASLTLPAISYDCIVFNDVLEHLLDPWSTLALSRSLLSPTGTVVASIPNIRHFPTLWKLVFRGCWDYQDAGTLDCTHLRFFTRSTIEALFAKTGFSIQRIEGINRYVVNNPEEQSLQRYLRLLQLIHPRIFHDMSYLQFAVRAVPALPRTEIMSRPEVNCD